uniref:GGDEF domain-containing protein n=1 Tax=Pelomonas sp. KK5 TaxID=1855730 RepID=UPI00097C1BF2
MIGLLSFMQADPLTLLMAIVLMLMTASAVWWSMAAAAAVSPRPSMCLALSNALLAGALGADAMHDHGPAWLSGWGSDLMGLAAFALLRASVPAIVGRPLAWRSALAIWLPVALGLSLSGGYASSGWQPRLLYLAMGALLLQASHDAWLGLRRQQLRVGLSAVLVSPLVVVFLLVVARLGMLLVAPVGSMRDAGGFNVGWLWATLLMCLVLNATMVCLIVMDLILSIQRLTRRDPLTDTYNRRALGEAIGEEHARLRRGMPYALVMIDMDHFKRLNDTLGHAAGDAALRRMVEVVSLCVREVDRLGRLGGEEFCALLPLTDLAGATLVAERMRMNLEESAFAWQG